MLGLGVSQSITGMAVAGGVILSFAVMLCCGGVFACAFGGRSGPQVGDIEQGRGSIGSTATTVAQPMPDPSAPLDQQYPALAGGADSASAVAPPPQAGIPVGQPYNPGFSAAAPPVYPAAQAAGAAPYTAYPGALHAQPPYPTGAVPAAAATAYPPGVAVPVQTIGNAQLYAGGVAGSAAVPTSDDVGGGLPSYDDVVGKGIA